jgi:hypothetical protein
MDAPASAPAGMFNAEHAQADAKVAEEKRQ